MNGPTEQFEFEVNERDRYVSIQLIWATVFPTRVIIASSSYTKSEDPGIAATELQMAKSRLKSLGELKLTYAVSSLQCTPVANIRSGLMYKN